MKRISMFVAALFAAVMLAGCGQKVDENKTPAQIKAEAANMDAAQIQKTIEQYQAALAEKTNELKAASEKYIAQLKSEGKDAGSALSNAFNSIVGGQDNLSPEAKKLKDEVESIKTSMKKLTEGMEAYADALKAKK